MQGVVFFCFLVLRLKTTVIVAFLMRIAHFDMGNTFHSFISCEFFSSLIHWFFGIVSFSWRMCQRRLAILLLLFSLHIRTTWAKVIYIFVCVCVAVIRSDCLIGRNERSAFCWYDTSLATMCYLTLNQRLPSVVIKILRTNKWYRRLYRTNLWLLSWPIISRFLNHATNTTDTQTQTDKIHPLFSCWMLIFLRKKRGRVKH